MIVTVLEYKKRTWMLVAKNSMQISTEKEKIWCFKWVWYYIVDVKLNSERHSNVILMANEFPEPKSISFGLEFY